MSGRGRNAILLAAVVVCAALAWSLKHDPARPNYEFLPDMVRSAAYPAYSASPVFADGKTLREPPAGTIPRGLLPLHFTAGPEEARRAGEQLRNPIAASDGAVQRGAVVFANFCQACHGAGGAGNGLVVQRGFPAPGSLLAEKAAGLKDGEIFHALTYGRGNMPSHAAQISREDRWKVILFVRTLQKQAQAAATPGAPAAAQPGIPKPVGAKPAAKPTLLPAGTPMPAPGTASR